MAKTRKVMEINDGGVHLVCIKRMGEVNPFYLYRVWWDGGEHRKLITKYADLTSVMWHLNQIVPKEWSESQSRKEGEGNG